MINRRILKNHHKKVVYTKETWEIYHIKRKRAEELLDLFSRHSLNPFVYGSIARGNVHRYSDIDIVFEHNIPIFKVEFLLNQAGYDKYFREIILATPADNLKLYIHLSELESITVPLTPFKKRSEFYNFTGKIDLCQLRNNVRVKGIDKRLLLITPKRYGHEEISVIGNESFIAKALSINISTVMERINVLKRREKFGHTGVFLKKTLQIGDSVENILENLAKKKSIVRKKLQGKL